MSSFVLPAEVLCWKLILKTLYEKRTINTIEYDRLYEPSKIPGYELTQHENSMLHDLIALTSDIEYMKTVLGKELLPVNDGESFTAYEWDKYLESAYEDGVINESERESYLLALVCKYDENVTDVQDRIFGIIDTIMLRLVKEDSDVILILDKPSNILQVTAVTNNPALITGIDNPSFDALMVANGISL